MTGYTLVGVNGQDEGVNVGFGSYLNFIGAGVTVTLSGDVLVVDIPGGGGGGGTPSAPFDSVQFNNAGAFGGTANFTWNGTGLVITDGAGTTDTLSPGTLLFTTAGTGTVSVKTGGGADGPLNLDILDLQVNGSSGLAGQVLTSAGPGVSPTWSPIPAASGWTDSGTIVHLTTATDQVAIGTNVATANRKVTVLNTGTDLGFRVEGAASTQNVLDTAVTADANPRFGLDVAGAHTWGPATTAYDLGLRRTAAGTLALDNNASGTASFVPRTDATCGVGTNNLRFADVIAVTHRVFAAAGAANPASSLSATAIQFGPGGGVALDTRVQRTGTSTLTFDNNAAGSGIFIFRGNVQTQSRNVGYVTTAATPYGVTGTDEVIFANPGANQVVNLPNAAGAGQAGRRITVKRVNTSVFTVTVGSGGGTIDGAATYVIAAGTLNAITVVSDGANWWII